MQSVAQFSQKNYKVRISAHCTAKMVSLVKIVLETGTETNLIDSRYIHPNCKVRIQTVNDPGLKEARRQSISVLGNILLQVRIGYLRIRAWVGVLRNLTMSVLYGTSLIDRFIKGILSSERRCSLPLPNLYWY